MTIELIDGTVRLALGAFAFLAMMVAFGLWRRGARTPVTVLLCLAFAAGGVLAVEALVALTVRLAAPRTAEFNEFRWVLLAPWRHRGLWLGGAAVVAICGLAWRASQGAGPARRAALVTLRTAAAAIALVVFLQPAVELRQVAREPNRVAILVDDSRSMSLADAPKGPTRTQRVRALLDGSGDTLDAWRQNHQLDVYTFSDAVASASLDRVATDEATGHATLLRKALETVRARYDGRDLAGVVLISDGAGTGDFDADRGDGALRDFLRSLDTKVHTVWAARPGLRDIAVARVLADEFAFVRTVVRLEAVIRSTGYGPKRVTVSLSSDGEVVRQKEVDLVPGENTVVFEVTPPRVGRYLYEISVPVAADEAVATNNARAFVIRVIRDKIRVLQVAGAPSWDVRALRAMLEENPNVDLISFFILRTQDSISLVPNDEMSLIPFPTRELFEEELPSFDLIVLQNFEFLPYGIGDYLENIRSYVEGGGGLAMLGGSMSFSSGGYHGTPVAAALPVELSDPWSQPTLLDTRTFQPELTEAGKSHPITALRYAVNDNLAAWKALPPLEGVNVIAGARPDATVLAVHPRLKNARGKPMPVIVAGDYGKGKSLAITTDSLWRWGFVASARAGDDGRAYTRLWENAIRWLIQDPDLRNLHVDSDAVEYAPGQPVSLRVRLSGRDYQPLAGGKVTLTWKKGADPRTATPVGNTQVVVGDDGTGGYELRGLAPGAYRIEASAEVAGKQATAGDIFLVRDASSELDQPAGDLETLARVAAGTGGRALGPVDQLPADLAFDAPRVVRVDRRADVELWSRPLLVLLAFLVLGLEWLLRQRSGYL